MKLINKSQPEPQQPAEAANGHLSANDLIIDRALQAEDTDALGHRPVADRVAELVATSATPLNVALFGAWGSGKSSFAQLLRTSLEKAPKVKLVTYNAWTFEGESLQRSFISSVATSLEMSEEDNVDYVQFHSGLYESRRSARLKLRGWDIAKLATVAGIVAVSALCFLIAVVALIANWAGDDVVQSVVDAIPSLLPTTAVTAILASTIREIIAGARVEVDASAPTQEQFREKFRLLVDRARTDKKHERLIIFVDELDRCSEEQVVIVLAAIRHFFDQPHCVFVVAADRKVIETALQSTAQQATPMNADNPYYSSASEYIDKIFQHQLALPPLRGRKLTRFARELVEAKTDGLWADLAAGDGGRLRDQLVYVLVPSHVRSPRRVKVLLNNFATDYRIAESRGIDARANAAGIAKLTALRTEFPLFTPDLIAEPRLPSLLLTPPSDATGRLKELLERHRLPSVSSKDGADLTETDVLLADPANPEQVDELKLLQRTLLRRYLVRTSQIPDPSRDLLYLERAGASVDLVDPAFGELLESASLEDPDVVATAALDQTPAEVRKAIRVLADMVSQEFGRERTNVVTAILALAEQLRFEVGGLASEIVGALKVQLNEEGFEPTQLAPALAVALKTEGKDGPLGAAILANPQLMADASQTSAVANIADGLAKERRLAVWDKLAEFYPTNPEILDVPVSSLRKDVAKEMLEHVPLAKARRTRWNSLAAEEAAAEIDALLERASHRPDESEGIRGALLIHMPNELGNGYAGVLRHESDLPGFTVRPAYRTMIALLAIRVGPAADWPVWGSHLGPTSKPWPNQGQAALSTAAKILERWPEAAGVEEEAAKLIGNVAQLIPPDTDSDLAVKVDPAARTILGSGAWWDADASATAQGHLYDALMKLATVGPKAHAVVSELVVEDIERAFPSGPTAFAYREVGRRAKSLDILTLRRLATSVADITPQPGLLEDHARARIEIAIAGAAAGENVQLVPYAIGVDEMKIYLGTAARSHVLSEWYGLSPESANGIKVALELGASPRATEREPAVRWAAHLSTEDRTDLLLKVSALANDTSDWVGELAREPVDEDRIMTSFSERIRLATRGDDRTDIARTIAALRPASPSAQQAVGKLAVWLLDEAKHVDDEAAVILLPALGDKHRMGSRLAKAIADALERGAKFSKRAVEDLRLAKVPVKKKSVPQEFWDRLTSRGRR